MMQAGNKENVFVSGSFDDIKAHQVRFLERASKLGSLTVDLWSDETIHHLTGKAPKFTQEERFYFVKSVRYVSQVILPTGTVKKDTIPTDNIVQPTSWAVMEEDDTLQKRAFCAAHQLKYIVLKDEGLADFAQIAAYSENKPTSKKKVIVTGCFDWLHSGHIRFFEETSALGDLYVVLVP